MPTVALALALSALALFAGAGQAAIVSPAHSAATAPLGGVNAEGLGYRSTPANADHTIALAVALHAKILRIELPWSILEPKAANQLDPSALAYTDRLMADASEHSIGIIMMIDNTPCWASSAPAKLRRKCFIGQHNLANQWAPSHPANYASLVGFLAKRYGNSITALEVWNEPDQANERYFAGPHKPQRYAALLKDAYAAVKQADPNISVLAGSLVGANGTFLRLLYKAGIKGHYDGLAIHFYTLTLASVRAFRAVQVANGDTTPLWLDEFGWTDCYPRHKIQEEQACVTPAVQALNITNLYSALGASSYIAAVTVYELQDEGGESFGVVTTRDVRKPAFSALANVLSSPIAAESPVTLSLRSSRGHVVASGSGPVGDFMRMEAFHGSTLRYRAVFTLDRFNRFKLNLPRALGSHGLRIRVYQFWTGPSGAVEASD
jgi:polysaccharide biosynthesis protein PslG